MALIYYAGRIFQLIGLLAMPSAIWVGHLGHNEQGAIAIFLGSMLVFFIGFVLVTISRRV